jgi:hypothetical protein
VLNGCLPSSGTSRVNVYATSAGGTPVATATGSVPGGTVTVTGLTPGTQYWYDYDGGTVRGPVSTLGQTTTTTTTTTTTCQSTPGAFLSATTTTLTFRMPTVCNGGGAPGVFLYTSPDASSQIGWWEGGSTATASGLTPGTQYWYKVNGTIEGPVSTLPSTTTTTSTTTTSTTTTSTTTTSTTTTSTTTTSTTTTPAGCTAAYKVVSSWPGGYQGEVTVTATAPLSAWTVTWTLASGQSVQQAWNATLTTSGTAVTAKSLSWNGTLATGASATFGFLGGWSGSNPVPALTCRPA